MPREPAPDLGILGGLPQIVLVLRPERLDDDEAALQARGGAFPPCHQASRI
jgi:hypothetical protein